MPDGESLVRLVPTTGTRQTLPAGNASQLIAVAGNTVPDVDFGTTTNVLVTGTVTGTTGAPANFIRVYSDTNGDGAYEPGEPTTTSANGGAFAFSNLPAGTYSFRIVLPAGYQQVTPTSNAAYTVSLAAGGTDGGASFTIAPATRLTGTTYGTPGSYKNGGNTIAKATDGNVSTYYDAATASGGAVGIDLGAAKVVSQIAFAPRAGYASRMVGGVFQASNDVNFGSGVVTVYTVTAAPASGTLTSVGTNTAAAYRYWRYVGPDNGYCNIAEFQLFA